MGVGHRLDRPRQTCCRATIGGATETYVYDGTGTRFSRQVGAGTPIRYVSDVAGGLPTVIDDGARKFVYGLGLAYAASGYAIEVYRLPPGDLRG